MKEETCLLTVEDALKLGRDEVTETYRKYVNPGWAALQSLLEIDFNYVRAEGCVVWDEGGNEYLDFVGGFGSLNLGHNHPAVLEALRRVEQAPVILQTALGKFAAVLAHNLARAAPGELQNCWFCSSGAEAVEGALKLARIYTGRKAFLSCTGGFHGKTMGALSVTGREKYRHPFEPLLPFCINVPFGDAGALERALREHRPAAFIVEPILGEGGIILPPPGYLEQARLLCSRSGTLLILDEIQTGLGRTGTLFACQQEGVVPDVLVLAKSLGGGVAPIGAYITTAHIMKKAYGGSLERGLMLTSTFGGNTRSTAAAIASLEVLLREDLPRAAAEKGDYFLHRLKELQEKYDAVEDVRGRGLLIGMELAGSGGLLDYLTAGTVQRLSANFLSSLVAAEMLKKYGVMVAFTLNNPRVIRLEPPLTVGYEQIDRVVEAFDDFFSGHGGFVQLALKSGKGAVSSLLRN